MRFLRAITSLTLILSLSSAPHAFANSGLVAVQDFPSVVDGNTNRISAEYALPASVVLGTKSRVTWGYREPLFKNEFGDQYSPESGIWSWKEPFTVKVEGLGRKATITMQSELAVQVEIQIYAEVDGKSYQALKSINFLPSTSNDFTRVKLPQLPSDFNLELDIPDPGRDLQTVVRARITGSGEWSVSDFYIYNSTADRGKTVVPNEWASWEISAEDYRDRGMYFQASWRVPVGMQYGNSSMNLAPIFLRKIPTLVKFGAIPISSDNTTISFECSYIQKKDSFDCTVGLESTATGGLPAVITVQSRVDGKPWGNKKSVTLGAGKTARVTMQNLKGKNKDIQAIYSRQGVLIESDMSSWVTKSASSSKPFSEAVFRSILKKNCSNLPARFSSYKFSRKGTTFNSYGEPLTIYGFQLLRATVYDGDSFWQIGAYTSEDTAILDFWECSYPLKMNK